MLPLFSILFLFVPSLSIYAVALFANTFLGISILYILMHSFLRHIPALQFTALQSTCVGRIAYILSLSLITFPFRLHHPNDGSKLLMR